MVLSFLFLNFNFKSYKNNFEKSLKQKRNFKNFLKNYLTDLIKVGIIFYVLINLNQENSITIYCYYMGGLQNIRKVNGGVR